MTVRLQADSPTSSCSRRRSTSTRRRAVTSCCPLMVKDLSGLDVVVRRSRGASRSRRWPSPRTTWAARVHVRLLAAQDHARRHLREQRLAALALGGARSRAARLRLGGVPQSASGRARRRARYRTRRGRARNRASPAAPTHSVRVAPVRRAAQVGQLNPPGRALARRRPERRGVAFERRVPDQRDQVTGRRGVLAEVVRIGDPVAQVDPVTPRLPRAARTPTATRRARALPPGKPMPRGPRTAGPRRRLGGR